MIALDPKCSELLTIYSRDREKNTTGPRQEALYRLCAEQIVQDENIYRIEYVCFPQLCLYLFFTF